MAKKEDKKEKKVVLERVYNIPLRQKYQRAPRWKRTNRAVSALREFAMKHMKATEVKIGKYANLALWKDGIKNPPHHIKVECKKDEEGLVIVELVGAPKEKPKEAPKKPEAKAEEKKDDKDVEIEVKDALGGEDADKKEIKDEKAEEAKKVQKEEMKEMKKEHQVKAPQQHAPKQPTAPKQVQQRPTAPQQKG
ncbi:MAG: 50S ribosomal protein L31e [Nanoarchaeota archaeon]|nr:50S ribosomal protein L31e [Nanoarchaeota archaeon]